MISLAVFATQFLGKEAYNYLINASGLSGFIAWLGIAVAHYRFRRAYVKQGRKLSDLKYKATGAGVTVGMNPFNLSNT